MQARRECWGEKYFQKRILYPAKLSFRNEGKIQCFPDKQKLKVFTSKLALEEMVKGLL